MDCQYMYALVVGNGSGYYHIRTMGHESDILLIQSKQPRSANTKMVKLLSDNYRVGDLIKFTTNRDTLGYESY